HDVNKHFPKGNTQAWDENFGWTWMAFILPYVEQNVLYQAAITFARSQPQSSWVPYGNGVNYSYKSRAYGELFPNPDIDGANPGNFAPPVGLQPPSDGVTPIWTIDDAGINPGHQTVVPTYKCPSDWRSLIASVEIWGPASAGTPYPVGSFGSIPTCFTSHSGNAGHKGNIDYH